MKEVIPEAAHGMRLDHWLAQIHPEQSRSFWQNKIKSGEVRVNKRKTKPHTNLHPGDTIQINLKTETPTLKGEEIPLDIIYEDENYAIINKPADLVVHPGAGHHEHTLVHALLHRYKKELSTVSGHDRPGIVHRLDKDTSGLLIIAKNDKTHRFLSKQFEEKTIKKKYITLVDGHLSPKSGTIDAPLSRNIAHRQKITVTTRKGSRHALTHYEVKKHYSNPLPCSLVDVKIETGRTHQIRVHFEAIDHPVIGDTTYGRKKSNQIANEHGLSRQFLHAAELTFLSPTTQKEVSYKSPLSSDLSKFLETLT